MLPRQQCEKTCWGGLGRGKREDVAGPPPARRRWPARPPFSRRPVAGRHRIGAHGGCPISGPPVRPLARIACAAAPVAVQPPPWCRPSALVPLPPPGGVPVYPPCDGSGAKGLQDASRTAASKQPAAVGVGTNPVRPLLAATLAFKRVQPPALTAPVAGRAAHGTVQLAVFTQESGKVGATGRRGRRGVAITSEMRAHPRSVAPKILPGCRRRRPSRVDVVAVGGLNVEKTHQLRDEGVAEPKSVGFGCCAGAGRVALPLGSRRGTDAAPA